MSSNVKVDWGSGGGKRRHTREVGNAKAAGPSEFGRLNGPMTGPAYGIRSPAIVAWKARTPQQQVLWRNNVTAHARALGVIKGDDPFADAKRLRFSPRTRTEGMRHPSSVRSYELMTLMSSALFVIDSLTFRHCS